MECSFGFSVNQVDEAVKKMIGKLLKMEPPEQQETLITEMPGILEI
jgi:hypothetical protein